MVLLTAFVGHLGAAEGLESVKQAADEWVKTRLETTRLETEWRTQRPLLESTVKGLAERAQALEAKRAELEARTARDREELAGFAALNQAATVDLQAAEMRVKAMSDRLLRLRGSLPPRLSAALEMSYRSLAGAGLAMNDRARLNLTILNRCTQFNRSITCEAEILNVGDGRNDRLLEVVYWGLSQAYALDRAGGKAWRGSPGPQGWQWEPHAEAAPAIARLIATYQDKADPEFITLPFQVHQAAESPTTGKRP